MSDDALVYRLPEAKTGETVSLRTTKAGKLQYLRKGEKHWRDAEEIKKA